ncbi:ParB N-terminal domain-containing protein [Myxococcus sp. NMCA1]|uniref:ParB N-terminal domain-containing protein n=1 Tax=Myxococcus sp. NMCA1 TaxID=2996785 RepID=UPI002286745A|nr:ParB N-terminal domain-containing protein [Myxococcus sp. NMCA1]WAM23791.1 ParB N-terminal domain-containing protein [Myxococcus sp. NMCA1]
MYDVEDISPNCIAPPHEVRDEAKLAAIRESMRASGWQGRPLLVLDLQDGQYVALTGSHRTAAARGTLDTVPCVVVALSERLTADNNLHWGGYDVCLDGVRLHEDEARLAAMQELGLDEAADLLAAEVESNDAA